MYDANAYRPCPICRTKLTLAREKFEDEGIRWNIYVCPNCGSDVWIDPFRRVREHKHGARSL